MNQPPNNVLPFSKAAPSVKGDQAMDPEQFHKVLATDIAKAIAAVFEKNQQAIDQHKMTLLALTGCIGTALSAIVGTQLLHIALNEPDTFDLNAAFKGALEIVNANYSAATEKMNMDIKYMFVQAKKPYRQTFSVVQSPNNENDPSQQL